MNNKSLRSIADKQLSQHPAKPSPTKPLEQLLHELQVHHIELEMQNEELRNSHIALEEKIDYPFNPKSGR